MKITLKNTVDDFNVFFKSSMWKDLCSIMQDGIEQDRIELEDRLTTGRDADFLRGSIDRLKRLQSLPDVIESYAADLREETEDE